MCTIYLFMAKKPKGAKSKDGMNAYNLAAELIDIIDKSVERNYTIGDVETGIAAMLVTVARSIDAMYPEIKNEGIDGTLGRFITVSSGANNSMFRILLDTYALCDETTEEDKCPRL